MFLIPVFAVHDLIVRLHSTNPTDRDRVVRPLKVAGLLGAFNIFAIARGGGTTGQSGAVSVALARGLTAHAPDVEKILRKGSFIASISMARMLT
jgi:small subunit ribosomal protein S9